MIEIIVALGLVTMVALTIIGVFSRLLTSSSHTADQAAADLVAQSVLDKASRSGPPDWGDFAPGATIELETAENSQATRFLYKVDVRELDGSDHPLGSLYRVTVLVSWSGNLDKTSEDGGKLWVERSRLTYVESSGP